MDSPLPRRGANGEGSAPWLRTFLQLVNDAHRARSASGVPPVVSHSRDCYLGVWVLFPVNYISRGPAPKARACGRATVSAQMPG
jgi:hypothetical protein